MYSTLFISLEYSKYRIFMDLILALINYRDINIKRELYSAIDGSMIHIYIYVVRNTKQ